MILIKLALRLLTSDYLDQFLGAQLAAPIVMLKPQNMVAEPTRWDRS